jgi:hypothetical protein
MYYTLCSMPAVHGHYMLRLSDGRHQRKKSAEPVRIYIQDGFVIVADGREKESGAAVITSDRGDIAVAISMNA